jgi:hypothetical protein
MYQLKRADHASCPIMFPNMILTGFTAWSQKEGSTAVSGPCVCISDKSEFVSNSTGKLTKFKEERYDRIKIW